MLSSKVNLNLYSVTPEPAYTKPGINLHNNILFKIFLATFLGNSFLKKTQYAQQPMIIIKGDS